MTIKEIETLSGMERANVRFYEREGFIAPKRLDNGYRDYSEDELQILLRVKLLRSLHISLDEIKEIKEGSTDLAETLAKQIQILQREKQDASYAQDVCRAMREDGVCFGDLDAQKYLAGINRTMRETGSTYFSVAADEAPQVFHPWRRYFARTFDVVLYSILWSAVLAFVFHVNIATRGNLGNIFDSFVVLFIMLFIEPLWLHFFGTTPGKAILGLRVETVDDRRLTYREGMARTWGVIGAGMGYGIPIYNIVRLWKSYKLCSEAEPQPWDDDIAYTLKDTKGYRSLLYIGAHIAVFSILAVIIFAQQLPPHRGDLTVAQFVENHNYYAKLYGVDFGGEYLDESGQWVEKAFDGTVYIGTGYAEKPEYQYTLENGYVTGVSFAVEINDSDEWLGSYDTEMLLASLAFAGAQDDMGLFSKIPNWIAEQIQQNTFGDFGFTAAGISVACDTEYAGYMDADASFLWPEEDAVDNYFSLYFSMDKQR